MNRLLSYLCVFEICGICFLAACSTAPKGQEPTLTQTHQSRSTTLTQESAITRSQQITAVSYRIWMNLSENDSDFQGKTLIQFNLKPNTPTVGPTLKPTLTKDIIVDFEGGAIQAVMVNGTTLKNATVPERYDGHHFFFKLSELKPEFNQIEISYSHPYTRNGNGLHHFKDPADGLIYLYSHFEPYSAHRVFPCFDQPDLKASYELTVEAPKSWQVISNTLEKEVNSNKDKKIWIFPRSALFSTYLFAIHAGPYSVWQSQAEEIPIRLFARKSIAKYVDYEEWLDVTRKGLAFYGLQFGYPYPFAKYDQVIVPDFNAGAMENVGAVTFNEKYVFRTRVTQDGHRGRADTILHEMAHMWFGDLVTMRWWNGLWLNESFATFMSAWAVDQATPFRGSWQAFFANIKQWAYWEDQLITTHPIELPVPDTEHAAANFDGITYGKGASTLKQLRFSLGEDDFREGLQRYFQKYAYRNTSIHDFIKMLAEASSTDLAHWERTWFQTSGVNTLRAEWACETPSDTQKSTLSQFKLIQGNPRLLDSIQKSSNEIRPHRIQVGFYYSSHRKQLLLKKTLAIPYANDTNSVSSAIGMPCPDFVLPNEQDDDYVKVELDPISLKFISQYLSQLKDPFNRQMIWHILWEMVVDGKLRAQDYADIVFRQSNTEKDTLVLSKILRTLNNSSLHSSSVLKFLTGQLRDQYHKKIESFMKDHLLLAAAGSDHQLVWYHSFLDIASTPQYIAFTRRLLEGKQNLKGLKIDQERRWELVQTLARMGEKNADQLIAQELKNDQTDMGQKSAIAAEVLIPAKNSKNKWLLQITRQTGDLPVAKMREAMANYQILGQEEFAKDSIDSYFETLPKLALSTSIENEEYARWFSRSMYPALCDESMIQRTTTLLNSYPDLPTSVVKNLKINRQEDERCIKARKISNNY